MQISPANNLSFFYSDEELLSEYSPSLATGHLNENPDYLFLVNVF